MTPERSEHIGRLAAAVEWKYPGRGTSKILKIDQAGDLPGDALQQMATARPVVLWRRRQDTGPSLIAFDQLREAGYRTALLFNSNGDFIQTISLDARQQLADLFHYFLDCDICAFHDEDADLCSRLRQTELENPRALEDSAQVMSAVEETIKRVMADAQTTELAAVRGHLQLDRNRLQLQIAELENRLSLRDAEIERLHSILRESFRSENLEAQVSNLRQQLDTSLALRAARSLHWILGPIRKRMGGTSNGGRR
jgi:hypothetical protein